MEYPHYSLPTVDLERRIFVPRTFQTGWKKYSDQMEIYRPLANRYNYQKGYLSQTQIQDLKHSERNGHDHKLKIPLTPEEITTMKDIHKKWMIPVPFRDIQGKHLKLGDFVYRIDYNKLTFGVIDRLSEGQGSLIFRQIRIPDWHSRESGTYHYEKEGLEGFTARIDHGYSSKFDSAKLIRVEKNTLSEFKVKLIKDILKISI